MKSINQLINQSINQSINQQAFVNKPCDAGGTMVKD